MARKKLLSPEAMRERADRAIARIGELFAVRSDLQRLGERKSVKLQKLAERRIETKYRTAAILATHMERERIDSIDELVYLQYMDPSDVLTLQFLREPFTFTYEHRHHWLNKTGRAYKSDDWLLGLAELTWSRTENAYVEVS